MPASRGETWEPWRLGRSTEGAFGHVPNAFKRRRFGEPTWQTATEKPSAAVARSSVLFSFPSRLRSSHSMATHSSYRANYFSTPTPQPRRSPPRFPPPRASRRISLLGDAGDAADAVSIHLVVPVSPVGLLPTCCCMPAIWRRRRSWSLASVSFMCNAACAPFSSKAESTFFFPRLLRRSSIWCITVCFWWESVKSAEGACCVSSSLPCRRSNRFEASFARTSNASTSFISWFRSRRAAAWRCLRGQDGGIPNRLL